MAATVPVNVWANQTLYLKIQARADRYDFMYAERPGAWTTLASDQDDTILRTTVAKGFVGTMFGLYARAAPC